MARVDVDFATVRGYIDFTYLRNYPMLTPNLVTLTPVTLFHTWTIHEDCVIPYITLSTEVYL